MKSFIISLGIFASLMACTTAFAQYTRVGCSVSVEKISKRGGVQDSKHDGWDLEFKQKGLSAGLSFDDPQNRRKPVKVEARVVDDRVDEVNVQIDELGIKSYGKDGYNAVTHYRGGFGPSHRTMTVRVECEIKK